MMYLNIYLQKNSARYTFQQLNQNPKIHMIVPFYIYHQRPDPIKNKVTINNQTNLYQLIILYQRQKSTGLEQMY